MYMKMGIMFYGSQNIGNLNRLASPMDAIRNGVQQFDEIVRDGNGYSF